MTLPIVFVRFSIVSSSAVANVTGLVSVIPYAISIPLHPSSRSSRFMTEAGTEAPAASPVLTDEIFVLPLAVSFEGRQEHCWNAVKRRAFLLVHCIYDQERVELIAWKDYRASIRECSKEAHCQTKAMEKRWRTAYDIVRRELLGDSDKITIVNEISGTVRLYTFRVI